MAFPATQAASADANTLDDYEEGAFGGTGANAILEPSTSGSITCGTYGAMSYTKVGRWVHVQGQVAITAVSSPVGNLILHLPFTVMNNGAGLDSRVGCGIYTASVDFPTSCTSPAIWAGETANDAFITASGDGIAWSNVQIASAAGQNFSISFSYQTA